MVQENPNSDANYIFPNAPYCNISVTASTVAPTVPHEAERMILCITHGSGDENVVINPVCESLVKKSTSKTELDETLVVQTCRVGTKVEYSDAADSIYGFQYSTPTLPQASPSQTVNTLKVVACGIQMAWKGATHAKRDNSMMQMGGGMGGSEIKRRVHSPIMVMKYGYGTMASACLDTDATKCKDAKCLKGGKIGTPMDTVDEITAVDCTSVSVVTEADNPDYPFCTANSDCPTKSCTLQTHTFVIEHNTSLINVTLYDDVGVDVNCTSDTCKTPGSEEDCRYYRCQENSTYSVKISKVENSTDKTDCTDKNHTWVEPNCHSCISNNKVASSQCPGGGTCRATANVLTGELITGNASGVCTLPDKVGPPRRHEVRDYHRDESQANGQPGRSRERRNETVLHAFVRQPGARHAGG